MSKELYEKARKYTMFSFTGSTQKEYQPFYMAKGDGIKVWDDAGREYIELGSQLANVNIGFNNKAVIDAVKKQTEQLAYVNPKHTYDQKGVLGEIIIEELAPENMSKVFFTLGGSDANEFAIRFAKAFTGRDKILSKYESYHGGTYGAGSLTGEPDRAALFPTIPGFVKFDAPHIYGYDIEFEKEEDAARHFLNRLEYQIIQEGTDKIAALFIEPVSGSNGAFTYPKGYLKGVRELCTKYGILMVCDEVMSGFLRCGDWFACERYDIEPDIITFAKGVNSSYAPLGGVILSREISDYYDRNPFGAGLTYNAHPLGVAAAIACIGEYMRLGTREHVLALEPVLNKYLNKLKQNHPSIGDVRSIGFHGAVEFSLDRNKRVPIQETADGRHFNTVFLNHLKEEYGLLTFGGGSHFLTSPPLITTEAELGEIFERLDKACFFADRLVEEIKEAY